MATGTRSYIQDENLGIHFKGTTVGREANVSKPKKGVGLGGLRPLANITNSGKPSGGNALKKKINNKSDALGVEQCLPKNKEFIKSQTSILVHDENLITRSKGDSVARKPLASDAQKKAGLGSRRALTNITNSKKLSLGQESKKNFPMKLDDIAEEQCLHDHGECIKSQTKGLNLQFFLRTLGFDDDYSMQLRTPSFHPAMKPTKVDSYTPLKHLEYEETLELLNEYDQSPPRCQTPGVTSPSRSSYPPSPTLMLAGTP